MSGTGRTVALSLGALLVFVGALLTMTASGAGIPLLLLGVLLFVGIAFEHRYGRPGQQPNDVSIEWRRTGERFLDEETGQPVEVLMDPLTGERRYEPMGDHPRLPRNLP
jgi:hypothetical protein